MGEQGWEQYRNNHPQILHEPGAVKPNLAEGATSLAEAKDVPVLSGCCWLFSPCWESSLSAKQEWVPNQPTAQSYKHLLAKTVLWNGSCAPKCTKSGTGYSQSQLGGPINLLLRWKFSGWCPHPKGLCLHSQGRQSRSRGAAQPGSWGAGTHSSLSSEDFCSRLLPWSKCPLVAAVTCLRSISHFTWF